MKLLRLFLPALLVVVFANPARAQGTISWDTGYPQKGSSTGAIAVQGSITLDSGWSFVGTSVTVRAWQDGLELYTTTIAITTITNECGTTNTWSGNITGLSSSSTYNVTVEVEVVKGCDTETIVTAPMTATAK